MEISSHGNCWHWRGGEESARRELWQMIWCESCKGGHGGRGRGKTQKQGLEEAGFGVPSQTGHFCWEKEPMCHPRVRSTSWLSFSDVQERSSVPWGEQSIKPSYMAQSLGRWGAMSLSVCWDRQDPRETQRELLGALSQWLNISKSSCPEC